MKKREITATGTVNNQGGLMLFMGEVNEFLKNWKGSKVIVKFSIYQAGSSEALKGYYYNYVVPTLRQAIWDNGERMTEEQTEMFIRELSPIMWEEIPDIETGRYWKNLRSIQSLSNSELIEHIETLKQLAAENFNVYIDDPKSI